jgi:hypothetical protein
VRFFSEYSPVKSLLCLCLTPALFCPATLQERELCKTAMAALISLGLNDRGGRGRTRLEPGRYQLGQQLLKVGRAHGFDEMQIQAGSL